MKPYRVLHFPGEMTRGGVENLIMSWYRNIDRDSVQFDFCVPRFNKGPLDDEIESLGGHILRCHRIREKGVLSYISEITSIIEINGPYDAVHIHGVHSGIFSLIASKRAGIAKRIYHVHSTQNLAFRHLRFHKVIERICTFLINRFATVRLACSAPAGEFVFKSKHFIQIKNGIDLNRFSPVSIGTKQQLKSSLGFPNNAFVIGNIARFVDGKNQEFLVRIIEEISARNPLVRGILVGEGPNKNKIEKMCLTRQINSKIVFTGHRSDTENLYHCMDVFCLPSDFEGLGIVAVEAQACGIPCLVSDGVPDEANMKCVPFVKMSLSDSIEKWAKELEKLGGGDTIEASVIKESILKTGYSSSQSLQEITRIYLHNAAY